jgi:hypothetical protein
MPTEEIAAILERSPAAVRTKRSELGLEPPSGRQYHSVTAVAPVTVADIQRTVADHFDIPRETMSDATRKRTHARPRQIAMFFARDIARKSYPRIGALFGHRDHTTVLHAVRTVQRMMSESEGFSHTIETLRNTLVSTTYPRLNQAPDNLPPSLQILEEA